MFKIRYCKNYRKHPKVALVKKELIKAYSSLKIIDSFIDVELTGVSEIDYRSIKFYLKKEYEEAAKSISDDIDQNDADFYGYHIEENQERLTLVACLDKILSVIDSYPNAILCELKYNIKSETDIQKYREVESYFRSNPVVGFNQKFYAVNSDGYKRQLFSFTLEAWQFRDAVEILVTYQ